MTELYKLTLDEALTGLANKEFSSVELTQSCLDRMAATRDLNAYVAETPEIALAAAKASDQRRAQGGKLGRMEGIPVGVKDVFCTKSVASTSCSKILEGFTPTYESTVTQKLFDAGGIMIGKTNMDEFAMGSANVNSPYGPVKNPWKRKSDGADVVPGGSSGGSAAAVAARSCFGSLGSDTGGSIRQPAAFTGTVGIKPTYGRCSRWGMIAFASSLDQAGVFTRTVKDAAIMLESICGHDAKDSTSSPLATPDFAAALTGEMKGKKVGIPKEYYADGMSESIKKFWQQSADWLKAAGAEVQEIHLPHTKYALPTYYILASAEASSNLARYDGVRFGKRVCEEGDNLRDMYEKTRAAGFGREVKRRIMIGTYVLSHGYYDAYYKKAQKVRTLISDDFRKAFEKVDVILAPTTPTPAFAIGEKLDPVSMYLNDVFTIPASLAGLPGLSVPVGLSSTSLPLGMQLIGKPFDEAGVLNAAAVIEKAAGFELL